MRKFLLPLVFGALLTAAAGVPAVAQSGFALKASHIYNHVQSKGATEVNGASGFGVGAEYVLPIVGLGVGVSAYTVGRPGEFNFENSTVNAVAEANYFFKLPLIPVAPYAGVHTGLGQFALGDNDRIDARPRDGWRQVGFQAGVRVQLISLLGVDAQFRRVSSSLAAGQGDELSRNQVLVGITLF
jgi:hypothetical protein